ncbi:D-aminoacyl-tRNA deacylase [Salinibius halmophilus]|uniref:D-aminoacyl-tRNA deacylase n=1 Tax=Salinibius halmophilus TaxID=1853216 RepID=UPI000E66AB72|nr:D-aminoacyl-tRNA deacylase [Salinibius halmophilus]
MKVLLQRVSSASVTVDERIVGSINQGLLLLVGVEKGDDEAKVNKAVEKVLNYRVFADADDKMNCSLLDVQGELLVVSQFTLAGDTRKGRRPSFSTAAPPAEGERLFNLFVETCCRHPCKVETGEFGANMAVALVNDGPVTFLIET